MLDEAGESISQTLVENKIISRLHYIFILYANINNQKPSDTLCSNKRVVNNSIRKLHFRMNDKNNYGHIAR